MISHDEREDATFVEAPGSHDGRIDRPLTDRGWGDGTRGCLRGDCRMRCCRRGGRDRGVGDCAIDPRLL